MLRTGLVTTLLVACKGAPTSIADASAPSIDRPDAGGGLDASTTSSPALDAGASRCVQTALQPGPCVPVGVFPLDRDASLRWLDAHGLRAAADIATAKNAPIEGCREMSFGPTRESVLACDEVDVAHVDTKLGLDGPAQVRNALRIVAVRESRLVTLVRVPVSVGSSQLEELFRANVTLDGAAGTLDVVVSPADCTSAPSRLDAYWDKHVAEMNRVVPDAKTRGELTHAMTSERKAGGPRIAEICAARGRYALADGRLVKQP